MIAKRNHNNLEIIYCNNDQQKMLTCDAPLHSILVVERKE
jgi:hypothetical protein